MLPIDAFIQRRMLILEESTPARTAARALRDQEVGSILVIGRSGALVGIVTDRDFACRWGADYADGDVPLSRIMTPDVISVPEDARMSDVIELMENHGIRRVPVVDSDADRADRHARVVGIVTLDDLIASGEVPPARLARIVRRQIRKRLDLGHPFRSTRATQRSEARSRQTLERFYQRLGRATGVSREITPQMTYFILSSLVMRMPASGGAHFIAQLPQLLHERLLAVPPGPDRQIDARWIKAEIASRFHIDEEFTDSILEHFFDALGTMIGPVQHVQAQLPRDLQRFFPRPTLHSAGQRLRREGDFITFEERNRQTSRKSA